MNSKDFRTIMGLIRVISKNNGFTAGLKGGAISGLAVSVGYDLIKGFIQNAKVNQRVQNNPMLSGVVNNAEGVIKQMSIKQRKALVAELQNQIAKDEAIEVPFEVKETIKENV